MILDSIISGVFGLGQTALNQQLSATQASRDRRENYLYGEMTASNADKRTRALYTDFYSPEALLNQYKEAGLSPSMMFGGTPGQGGMSGAMGHGASGIQTPYMPYSLLEAAQAASLFAQTKKTEEETKQIEGIANATVSSLLAEAGYKKAAAAAAEAQATGVKLDNYIKEHTKEASIYQICEIAEEAGHNAEKAYYEMKEAKLLNEFDQETFEDRKKMIHNQMEQIAQSIAESKSAEKLNEQQRKYVKDMILHNISQTELEWAKYGLSVEQFELFIEKQIPILEKQLDVELEKLDIQHKRLIIDSILKTFESLAFGAMAASNKGYGKGSYTTPIPPATKSPTPKGKGPKSKPQTIWEY